MLFGSETFAGVTARALSVVESVRQRFAQMIAIALAVGFMAIHTSHRAIEVAAAIKMRGLVAERFHSAIDGEGILKKRKLERKEILQARPWEVWLFADHVL